MFRRSDYANSLNRAFAELRIKFSRNTKEKSFSGQGKPIPAKFSSNSGNYLNTTFSQLILYKVKKKLLVL